MILNNLVLLDAGLFCVGMYVKGPVYYYYKGTCVLLCKDVLLTKEIVEKLNIVSKVTDGVYIREENYRDVWNESLRRHALQSIGYENAYESIHSDYNQVLSKTIGLLGDTSARGSVSMPVVENIVDDIMQQTDSADQSMMLRCINMINEADDYLYTHCINVATLNGLIGRWMKLPSQDVNQLIRCGMVHDLGKLQINPYILNKPGRLTDKEFGEIKRHPLLSHEILVKSGETNRAILDAVLQHHEKPNGTGYPYGLSSQDISLFARITAVSDVYDAMVSKRCYKEASTPFEVLDQLKTNRFSGLDMEIVNTFLLNVTFLFIGMKVKLSNGEFAEVVFVPPGNYANPVVKVGQRVFRTKADCKCIETISGSESPS